jgi:hypothetical protein
MNSNNLRQQLKQHKMSFQFDKHLLEEYMRTRKLDFLKEVAGQRITEGEKEAFLKRKFAEELKDFRSRGKMRGEQGLLESIMASRKSLAGRQDVSARELSGISSPLKPAQKLKPRQEVSFDPSGSVRRAHNKPVSSGGASSARGSHSHLGFLRTVASKTSPSAKKVRRRAISATNTEHFDKKKHARTTRWLEAEAPGHATPPQAPQNHAQFLPSPHLRQPLILQLLVSWLALILQLLMSWLAVILLPANIVGFTVGVLDSCVRVWTQHPANMVGFIVGVFDSCMRVWTQHPTNMVGFIVGVFDSCMRVWTQHPTNMVGFIVGVFDGWM